MVRLVRISFSMGTSVTGKPQHSRYFLRRFPARPPEVATARVFPPKEWITYEALMPRPPGDSRLELMYERSSKASRSTLMTRSMAGLIVTVTIKSSFYGGNDRIPGVRAAFRRGTHAR